MSDSRLEKFIYAICSMDVSDLPVPLSRIEKLWNCLITGETPDFEPLSRNEKYLMAMLDRYDISNLPAPMSRGEQLLYKIAVGETDLSDVPGYLSRYEELLKYLIENGGISGGDFEYVLYTLNQSLSTLYTTAEKPVKSAILKGNTLVNLVDYSHSNSSHFTKQINGHWSISVENNSKNLVLYNPLNKPLKDKTLYTIIVDITKNNLSKEMRLINGYTTGNPVDVPLGYIGKLKLAFTTNISAASGWNESLQTVVLPETTGEIELGDYILLEGDYTNIDIPYFEGMQSVKMPVLTTTGKNLFYGKLEYGLLNGNNGLPVDSNDYVRSQNFIPINCETITFTVINGECGLSFYYYDKDKNFISYKTKAKVSDDLSIPDGVAYFKFRTYPISDESITNNLNTQIQIEEGKVATEYEPYQSNILTVNEDVTLRGIGDVQDTLDCLTGELTQRIGEVVLDGSKEWSTYITNEDTISFIGSNIVDAIDKQYDSTNLMADKLIACGYGVWAKANNITLNTKRITICVLKSVLEKVDVNGFKKWLSENPIKVQYIKADEPIKTVDLTIVDQDNQPTELGTFEKITHVSLEAENLIPEVEMEVATNLLEDTVFNLTDAFNTLYPTAEKPVKSAILKGSTKYRDIDTGEILESFEEGRNLELVSVKMPVLKTVGKNLFNKNNIIVDGYIISNGKLVYQTADNRNATDYIEVESNCSYTISGIKNSAINGAKSHQYIGMYDKNKTYISTAPIYCLSDKETITTAKNTKYIRLSVRNDDINRLQIKKGTTPTTYEPHESNILTVNEPVELRGIGNIKDELNLLTGELTQRIGEVVLDGSNDEGWIVNGNRNKAISMLSKNIGGSLNATGVICADFVTKDDIQTNDIELIRLSKSSGKIIINILKSKLGLASDITDENVLIKSFNEWLSQNPLTVQYQLATNTVKTVDLTIQDQDGNETKLRTFDDTTHVLLNSEGLIPTAALTVRTKIPSASSTSLLMDDISTEQQQLNTTVDEQSENVDATMIATTEIFEETL